MNDKKICFISCVTDEREYSESLLYIDQLRKPVDFEVEKIAIRDAKSMAEAYNRAMKKSDPKYKVFLHQDVFIVNKNFIFDTLALFNGQDKIGILGVCGAKKLPENGIWWEAKQRFGCVFDSHTQTMKLLQFQDVSSDFELVEALDGLILMTQYDIPWREDLFDDFHFYDTSQCMEFAHAGYLVVVPDQKTPWVVHDCGFKEHWHVQYERSRKLFLEKYLQKCTNET